MNERTNIPIGNQTAFSAGTPLEPFEYALANGFDAFEWFPDKKPWGAGWDENDLNAEKRAEIRELTKISGMRLSVHARWQANPLKPDARAALLKDIELAKDLGASLLNIHLHTEAGLAAYVNSIAWLLGLLSEERIQLSIENTPLTTPEHFNQLFAELEKLESVPTHHAGVCFDLGHANLCAPTRNDYLKFLDALDPHIPITHLHLHENWGDSDSHLPLFTGPAAKDDSGVRGLLRRMRERKFSGVVILEQWPQPPTLLNETRDKLLALFHKTPGPLENTPKSAWASPVVGHEPATPVDFADQLIEANQHARSWREKLDAVRELLARDTSRLTAEQLADVAIYLRFLGTGAIACAEDGRHFRPAHHAQIALQIQDRLAHVTTPANAFIVRQIHPWLPSSAQTFRRAEPLTRIRDIAHRNDIPSDLKREIKHSLQNKLHRCAGPEDLATSAGLLERVTRPEGRYTSEFIGQLKIFHEELKEFFNARSLDEQLEALTARVDADAAEAIRDFISAKRKTTLSRRLNAFGILTQLRQRFLQTVADNPGSATENLLLADIGLEEFAFVLLSEIINELEASRSAPVWEQLFEASLLTLQNLELSDVEPEECQAIEAELRAWWWNFDAADRDNFLRLKATADRARRLAESYCDRIMELFPPRVEKLGRALGVAEHAIRVFGDAEIRSHVVFQLSKLASALLSRIRDTLRLAPWDVLVCGEAKGRLQQVSTLDDLNAATPEPVLVLLKHAEGDEEIPPNVAAIVLAHELPHLSHLGVRARQAGVVFVTGEAGAELDRLHKLEGKLVSLKATAESVSWKLAAVRPGTLRHRDRHEPVALSEAILTSDRPWLPLEEVTAESCGGKADGARRLLDLSHRTGADFKTPAGLAIPFGTLETALRANATVAKRYSRLLLFLQELSPREFEIARALLCELVLQLKAPDEIAAAAAHTFGPATRLMVRSSANCEDLEEFAGAGLYDSVGNVACHAIADAVRTVWASLWSRRAAASRQQSGIPHEQAHMAVLIQPMLAPDLSFILHTVNPITQNQKQIYAEIAAGLGETLASASLRGSPYRLVCDKDTDESSMLAFASYSHALQTAPAGGLERSIVDYSRIELSCDATARRKLGKRFAGIGRFVEEAFETPQDIEGAVLGGDIFLVQSRPQQGLRARKAAPAELVKQTA